MKDGREIVGFCAFVASRLERLTAAVSPPRANRASADGLRCLSEERVLIL